MKRYDEISAKYGEYLAEDIITNTVLTDTQFWHIVKYLPHLGTSTYLPECSQLSDSTPKKKIN